MPGVATEYPLFSSDQTRTFDPRVLLQSKENAIGQNLEQNLGYGWKIHNNLKYSDKKHNWQSSSNISPLSIRNQSLYTLLGTSGRAGIYTFQDKTTGEVLAQTQTVNGEDFKVLNSKLPEAGILQNGVFSGVGFVSISNVREWMNQFSITRKLQKMSFTGGLFMPIQRWID